MSFEDWEALRSAASRLAHDLGKAIRFSAPEEPEPDAEALRQRLGEDLQRTRRGPDGERGAAEVFDAWAAEEAAAFSGVPDWAARIERIRARVEEVRVGVRRLAELSWPELRRLDDASMAIAGECAALQSEVRRMRPREPERLEEK